MSASPSSPRSALSIPTGLDRFSAPDWDAPIDLETSLAEVPEDVTMAGMFLQALVSGAQVAGAGTKLPSARDRYVAFSFYPLREHVTLLFELAPLLFPKRPLRTALRKIGRAAPDVLMASTVGRVVLSSAIDPAAAVDAYARAYNINLKAGAAEVTEVGPSWAVVRLDRINFLSDSHQIGTFEGILSHIGTRSEVLYSPLGPHCTEYLLRW